jgi:hypothetical protein
MQDLSHAVAAHYAQSMSETLRQLSSYTGNLSQTLLTEEDFMRLHALHKAAAIGMLQENVSIQTHHGYFIREIESR